MGCAHTVSSGSLNEAHSFAGAVKVIDDYQLCMASGAPKLPQRTADRDDHPGQIAHCQNMLPVRYSSCQKSKS